MLSVFGGRMKTRWVAGLKRFLQFEDSIYGVEYDGMLELITDHSNSDPYKRNYAKNYSLDVTIAVVKSAIQLQHSDMFVDRKMSISAELINFLALKESKIDFLSYDDYDFKLDKRDEVLSA